MIGGDLILTARNRRATGSDIPAPLSYQLVRFSMSKDTKTEDSSADFDLPDVSEDAPKATAPRVHIGGSTCEGCEG